ncbi:ferredoxin reductase [Kaistia algarum]|uniref:NAD(P)/FAD-dependent oxidoreductase n=1 Tax=Kaistia algarum TaxID=2083279 RepID=UPI000CE7A84E|nr:FAD-dependent oxidoreductase [Kaistia algarum]MCX5512700.1 FAD-dependent oxidoreductase [Kaistia algarum]PPE81793.1 ferredoxin reductase [Kaistia algarum]
MTGRMLIIGAGEAGARAAMALRENGFAGTVTIIGDEPHLPYERPPLSKSVLAAESEPAAPFIHTEARLAEQDIAIVHGTEATSIDRAGHTVTTANGAIFPYDRLLLATGAKARRLRLDGAGPDNVLYLRTFREALALRSRLMPGSRLVLIGGGFIGLELAAAARLRGCDVTVIEMAPRLLARAVPADMAARIAARHEAAGVRLILGAGIERIEGDITGHAVLLSDGERVPCDGIIAGIGAVPETELAEAAGLAIENGIKADERLQTSDPDIFAAGDCCSFPLALYGGRRIRLEAWRNAQDQGNHAARSMLGASEPYDAVPWFWSDQYDLTLQIAGLPDEGSETIIRDLGDSSEIRFRLAPDGRLLAASAIGPNGKIAKDIRLAEMMIARRAKPDRGALGDPNVKLKTLFLAPAGQS